MSQKAIKTIGWILTIALTLFFGLTSILKLLENEQIVAQTTAIGIDSWMIRILGLIELLAIILFIVPRTGIVGTLLLIAYMGGVMATALQHHQPMAMFTVIQVLVWIAAVLRFPELGQRLFGLQKTDKK